MTLSQAALAAYDFWRPNRFKVRPYLIRDGKTHPVAVICPGGGYAMVCSYVEGEPIAKALNKRGYSAVVVYYRVKKAARYPAPQDDLERAIRTVFDRAEEWDLDPEDYSLWGSSAGGHLCASFCAEKRNVKKPASLILVYPVITMGKETHPDTRKNLLGPSPDPALVERLSVEKQVGADYPPTYLWNGTADTVVDPVNSRLMEAALQKAGVSCRTDVFEGVGHGVGLASGTSAEPWLDHAVSFWESHRTR